MPKTLAKVMTAAPAARSTSATTVKRAEPVDIRAAHQAWLERTGARNDHW
jgi:hypothetical protein